MAWQVVIGTLLMPLRRAPYASGSLLLVFLAPLFFGRYGALPYLTSSVLLFFSFLAYQKTTKLKEGGLWGRRRFEAAFAALAAIEISAIGLPGVSWLALPLFLYLIYGDFELRTLLLLFAWHASYALLGEVWPWQEVFVVGFSLGIVHHFHSQQRHRNREVADRLSSYEREANAISVRSEEFQEALRFEGKKNEHLTSMIQEREAGFESLVDLLCKTLSPQTAALFLFDPLEETFLLKTIRTSSDRISLKKVFRSSGIFKAVLREEGPIRSVSASGELRGLDYYVGPPLARSVAAVPLKTNDLFQGLLILDKLDATGFSTSDMETITRIAGELARLIDTSETLHAYFHLKEELTSLYSASRALSRDLRLEEVMRTLLESTRKIVAYDLGLVVLFDSVNGKNRVAAGLGAEGEDLVGESFACAPERGLISWVVRNQTPLAYDDFRSREGKTPLFHKRWPLANVFDSVLILPMQVQGEPMGAILFAAHKNRLFPRNERKMMEVVTNQAAISIKNARMVSTLEALATTDGLTGLTNHRTFQETLESELARSGRHPSPTSLLLIDIDHFKKFNDEYGHPIGDVVLKGVAEVLGQAVRQVDLAARYGGEEFAIILVNTSPVGAKLMAERIVQTIAKSRFQEEGLNLRVTASVGVATFPDDAKTREELIERSDQALYAAKGKGRNRAVAFAPSMAGKNKEKIEERRIEGVEAEARRSVKETIT